MSLGTFGTVGTEGGNTESPSAQHSSAIGGTKKSKVWCFTSFDVTENWQALFLTFIGADAKYCFQQEECPETGKLHIQGVVAFKNARHLGGLIIFDGAMHWERAKSFKASVLYCSDPNKLGACRLTTNVVVPRHPVDPMSGLQMKPWQIDLSEQLSQPPDQRKIIWLWEDTGGVGKTTFCKSYCLKNKDALLVGGRVSDMKYAVSAIVSKRGHGPRVIFFDIPRSRPVDMISWDGLEELKNGMFFSGKYESGMVMYDIPHLVVFANYPPDITRLSGDRWNIKQI